jgi:hypothetical protein
MIARTIPLGSMMNTARTVWDSAASGCSIPNKVPIFPVLSAMMGNLISTPSFSLIHSTHLMWEKTWSMDRPISSQPSCLNSS